MNIKKIIKRQVNFFVQLFSLLKYGGFSGLTVSQINYGELFKNGIVVLVTGGGSGIGLAIAKKFAHEGAKVIITGRNISKLQNAIKESGLEESLIPIKWDISNTAEIPAMLDLIEEQYKLKIDILVNNAGIYAKTQFPNCTSEDWDNVYTTNAKGTFFLSQELIRRWIKDGNMERVKKIINISSQGGFVGANNPYRMTKWDIRGLTNYLGKTFSKNNIIVNAIAPGIIKTDMQPEFANQGDNYYTDLNPANRIGLPEEIAELALFLASDAANFIVGQTICCDGGYSI